MAGAVFAAARRLLLAVAAALGLAACAQLPNQVAVGIGTAPYVPHPAKPYSVLYKSYAQMGTVAYTNAPYLTASACPDVSKLRASGTGENREYADAVPRVVSMVSNITSGGMSGAESRRSRSAAATPRISAIG